MLYAYILVLASILYPIACYLIWDSELALEILGFWFGPIQCLGVGIWACGVLWLFRQLAQKIPPILRPLFVRLIGAEIVGVISIVQLVVSVWLDSGEWIWPQHFWSFIFLQFPGFLGSYGAYHLVGMFYQQVAPRDPTPAKRR